MKLWNTTRWLAAALLVGALAACATQADQPIRTATVRAAQPTMRKVFTPSAAGGAVGGVAGGVLGHQVGGGNGKKVATVAGAVLGAAAGATMAGQESFVQASIVELVDDENGEVVRGVLDGTWQPGMKLRYTKKGDKIVVR